MVGRLELVGLDVDGRCSYTRSRRSSVNNLVDGKKASRRVGLARRISDSQESHHDITFFI